MYQYECRTRQYDKSVALWAYMDDPTISAEEADMEHSYMYPDRHVPMMKTSVRRWVCVHVGHDMDAVNEYLHAVVGFEDGKVH